VEVNTIETPVRGANLILRPNRLMKQLLLNVHSIGGKCMLITHLLPQSIKAEEEAYCKCRARAQTGSSWQISHMMNFDALIDFHELQARAHRRVFDAVVPADVLDLQIGNAAVVLEEGRQISASDITAFVDRSR